MKKLSELYTGYPDIDIKDIKINSKEVTFGDLFICIKGITTDRNDYIEEAIKNGASAIVTNKDIKLNVPVIKVDNPNEELYRISKQFYDYNSNYFKIIGVTGTNGKTTVASIIKDMIGNKCGYIGTNGLITNNINESIRNTTPDVDRLYKYFKMLKEDNCNIISMETSSEAFYRKRLKDINFDIGIVTNVYEDHLNIHKTIDNYLNCKKELVKSVKNKGYSILNVDCKYYEEFKKAAKGTIYTYGKGLSDLQIINIREYYNKTIVTLKYKEKKYRIKSLLTGEYNVYNLCAAILALIALNYSFNDILNRIKNIKVPKGRAEFLDFGQNYKIILDYAHTTEAFIKMYNFLNKIKKNKIITVTGSAGGREKEKRSTIGNIVLNNSNYVIFTMDDPRYEDVNDIINDLIKDSNKRNYEKVLNRADAIMKALSMANKDDIVLIAGKGRDNYMAIEDKYIKYNDYDVICNYFKNNN